MKKGFTLIELLVVITIVGICSSIVLHSLTEARIKSEQNQTHVPSVTTITTTNDDGCDGLRNDGAPQEAIDACRADCNQNTDVSARNLCIHGNNF